MSALNKYVHYTRAGFDESPYARFKDFKQEVYNQVPCKPSLNTSDYLELEKQIAATMRNVANPNVSDDFYLSASELIKERLKARFSTLNVQGFQKGGHVSLADLGLSLISKKHIALKPSKGTHEMHNVDNSFANIRTNITRLAKNGVLSDTEVKGLKQKVDTLQSQLQRTKTHYYKMKNGFDYNNWIKEFNNLAGLVTLENSIINIEGQLFEDVVGIAFIKASGQALSDLKDITVGLDKNKVSVDMKGIDKEILKSMQYLQKSYKVMDSFNINSDNALITSFSDMQNKVDLSCNYNEQKILASIKSYSLHKKKWSINRTNISLVSDTNLFTLLNSDLAPEDFFWHFLNATAKHYVKQGSEVESSKSVANLSKIRENALYLCLITALIGGSHKGEDLANIFIINDKDRSDRESVKIIPMKTIAKNIMKQIGTLYNHVKIEGGSYTTGNTLQNIVFENKWSESHAAARVAGVIIASHQAKIHADLPVYLLTNRR